MTTDDKIRDEKLQYHINREAGEISGLSFGKIDKYDYFTSEEIIPSNQKRVIEQAKFTYSPIGKALEKQTKTMEDQGTKQIKAIEKQFLGTDKKWISSIFSKYVLTEKAKNESIEIIKIRKQVNGDNLIYKTGNKKKG